MRERGFNQNKSSCQKHRLSFLLIFILLGPFNSEASVNSTSSQLHKQQNLLTSCRVFIDPGHGGKDLGSQKDDLIEKDLALRWALAWGKFLEQQGWMVQYSRTKDLSLSSEKRREWFDKSDCPILISWHMNTHPQPVVHGTEFYYNKPLPPPFRSYSKGFDPRELLTDLKIRLHQKKQQAWVEKLSKSFSKFWPGPIRTRGAPLKILQGTQKYGVLIEVGYLSHPQQKEWLKEPDPKFFQSLFFALKETDPVVLSSPNP